MTNKEKIEWLEEEVEYVLPKKKYHKAEFDKYDFKEDLARREIDRLYDIENAKNDNIKS